MLPVNANKRRSVIIFVDPVAIKSSSFIRRLVKDIVLLYSPRIANMNEKYPHVTIILPSNTPNPVNPPTITKLMKNVIENNITSTMSGKKTLRIVSPVVTTGSGISPHQRHTLTR